ncbi:hypothetical protein [Bosea sp. Leaf344]|uniref:hypothetical protein n=1 Tax=Bosea sp. Leaf344 TaxID=1736346 RepID=UPI0012E34FBE|nr:hypothetical protein [Bosea sp. Leaf344]
MNKTLIAIASSTFLLSASVALAQTTSGPNAPNSSAVTDPASPDRNQAGGKAGAATMGAGTGQAGTVTTGTRAGATGAIDDPARPDRMKAGGKSDAATTGAVRSGNRAGANAAINDPASPDKQSSKKMN